MQLTTVLMVNRTAMYLFVIILWINCVSSNPTMSPAPVAEVGNNGNVTITCSPLMRESRWDSYNFASSFHIQPDCTYIFYTGNMTSDMDITCKNSTYSALTLSRVSRYRHGQIWYCQGPYYTISYPTVVVVKELAAAETCSRDTEIEVCPYPVAYFVENQSLKISARYTGPHIVKSIHWTEYMKNSPQMSHLVYPNCSYGFGDIPDGYEFICNSSQAQFTMIIKNVRHYMHGQMLKIEFEVSPVSTISKYIILSREAKENSSTIITTPSMNVTMSNGTIPRTSTTIPETNTSESTLTISNGTTRQTPPTTTRESSPSEYDIQLVLLVKVVMEFNENYQNKLSSEYQSLAGNFSASLTDIYKSVMGFKSIDVLRFSPSIVAEYSANFYENIDLRRVTEEIKNKVVYSFKTIAGAPVDADYTIRTMTEMLDLILKKDRCSLASENICPFGYVCKPSAGTTVVCLDRCNSRICQNNGECYIGHRGTDVQCRCPISSDVAYSGSRCEIRHEVMLPEQKVIYIVIGCILILGILIMSVVIISLKRQLIRQKETFLKEQTRDDMVLRTKNDTHASSNKCVTDTRGETKRGSDIYLDPMGERYRDPSSGYLTLQTQREESAYDYIDPHNKVLSEPRFDIN